MEDQLLELQETYQSIMQSVCAEEVFGALEGESPDDKLLRLEKIYQATYRTVNPLNFEDNLDAKDMAHEASEMLEKFHVRAGEKIKNGVYGEGIKDLARGPGIVIKTETREYQLGEVIAEGDISTIIQGECINGTDFAGRVAVKIINDPADNDLIMNELRVLKIFMSEPGMQNKHLPVLLDHFRTNRSQLGIIMRLIDAYDLNEVRKNRYYRRGVPSMHAAWVLERCLSLLGFAHVKGILHNNIEPAHIMLRPRDHNVFIIDWSYSAVKPAKSGEGFRVLNEEYSPPEVEKKLPPLPSSDLYSLGKSMIYLLGGDIKTNQMPKRVDERFQRFIRFMVMESPVQRSQDAWEMYGIWRNLRAQIFGPGRFVEFKW
jgi:serine/threonine protein kinase